MSQRALSGVCAFIAFLSSACDLGRPASTGELAVIYRVDGEPKVDRAATYHFGAVLPGQRIQSRITVMNVGTAPITLDSLERIDGASVTFEGANDGAATFVIGFVPGAVVPPGTSVEFDAAVFAPCDVETGADLLTDLRLEASGAPPDKAVATIRLVATPAAASPSAPNLLDFGVVAVGDSVRATFDFVNPTSAAAEFELDAPLSSGSDHSAFTFADGTSAGKVAVEPNSRKTLTVAFAPTQPKDYLASFTVRQFQCVEQTVQLRGTGVGAILSWSPMQVDCGFASPGVTVTRELTFQNLGPVEVSLTQIKPLNASEFFVEGAGDRTRLVIPAATQTTEGDWIPGSSALRVACKPMALGPRQTQLTFSTPLTNQSNGSITVKVYGGGPDIEVVPEQTLDFGDVAWFANASVPMSVSAPVLIRNVGTQGSTLDSKANLRLEDALSMGSGFSIVPLNAQTTTTEFMAKLPSSFDPALGLPAAGGQNSLPLAVVFSPASVGLKEAELTIFSNDPDEPQVKLTLRANAVAMPPCNYSVSDATLAFGTLEAPETRTLAFSITNLGTAPGDVCALSYLDLTSDSHPSFEVVGGPIKARQLAPGESHTVFIRFSPPPATATPQNLTGRVRFSASSPTKPVTEVPLLGVAATPCLVIAPDEFDFGTVQVGCSSATRTFNVYNNCSTAVTINTVALTRAAGVPGGSANCPGSSPCPEIALNQAPPGGTTVPALGGPVAFSVRYTPLDAGRDLGRIEVAVSEAGGVATYVVPLEGRGASSALRTDDFPGGEKADVLLTIQDSSNSSMAVQADVSNHASALLSYATIQNTLDFHLAVTTTDNVATTRQGRFVSGPAHPEKVLTQNTVDLKNKLKAKVVVGGGGSPVEEGLATSLQAVTAPLVNADNGGFLRPDASLAVVVIGDEPDQSPRPISYYLEAFSNVKGHHRRNRFTFSAISGFTPACAVDDGKLATAVRATGGYAGEICTTNWPGTLAELGKVAFGERRNLLLSSIPDTTLGPIEVRINGALVPSLSGTSELWTYDPVGNAVVLSASISPAPNDTVSVSYSPACYL